MSGNDMRKYFDSLINPNAAKETENKAPKAEEAKAETAQNAPVTQERVFKKPTENVYEQMRQQEKASRPNQDNRRPQGERPARNGQNGGYNNRANQPAHRETVHTEIIMAKVDIITVTMVTDQPVCREITADRDQTVETRDHLTMADRVRASIRETVTEDVITSVEKTTVED
jgi:hypothetical protein